MINKLIFCVPPADVGGTIIVIFAKGIDKGLSLW